jgi:FMN reductase (NADPH)/FMN reductase [NAD(P)H]
MEHYEVHRELLDLQQYAFPITMVCFGYPTRAAQERTLTTRFPQGCIHFTDRYRRLEDDELLSMLEVRERGRPIGDAANVGQHVYERKFSSPYSVEMTRSVREAIRTWASGGGE